MKGIGILFPNKRIMDKIIGGEFAVDHMNFRNLPDYPEINDRIIYATGRGAFYAILKDIELTTEHRNILLPNYLCDSITRTVIDAGWQYQFYNVNEHLEIDIDNLFCMIGKNSKVVFLINYFGLIHVNQMVEKIRNYNNKVLIIVDSVQAFYEIEKTKEADYQFSSIRKWFPCPDGAVIKKHDTNMDRKVELEENRFAEYKLAGNFLKKYSHYINDELSLELIRKGEEILDQHYLCRCSGYTNDFFSTCDFAKIAEVRKKNALFLHNELDKLEIKHAFDELCTPLCLPIFIQDRDRVRKGFFSNHIFTPVHWPWISKQINGTNPLYECELSLICDQRYDENDMERQLTVLKSLIR